jgi:hypothetical protein
MSNTIAFSKNLAFYGTLVFLISYACQKNADASSFDAKRLYDDLLTGYNRLIRPVGNNTEKLTVYMGLKLTQILDVVVSLKFQFKTKHKNFNLQTFTRMRKTKL